MYALLLGKAISHSHVGEPPTPRIEDFASMFLKCVNRLIRMIKSHRFTSHLVDGIVVRDAQLS